MLGQPKNRTGLALNHAGFYFLFCAFPTPKNRVFETTQKRFFTLLGFKSAFSHQNDHPQTPIKGHTNACFSNTHFGCYQTPKFRCCKHTLHFFYFARCQHPKTGCSKQPKKDFLCCWDSKVLFKHFSPHNLFFLFHHCS